MKTRLKPKIRYGFYGMIIGAILAVVISVGGCFALGGPTSKTAISGTTLKASLEQASDLITTKYYYSDIGKFDNSYEINGWSIPFTGKNFILSYQGEAMLGFQTDRMEVKVSGSTINVTCPDIQVLSNSIPAETVEVYDQSFNIFNQVTINDYLAFETEQKARAEEKMQTNGTFDRAREDAKRAITELLNMIPEVKSSYTINVTFDPALNPQTESTTPPSSEENSDQNTDSQSESSEASSQENGDEPAADSEQN